MKNTKLPFNLINAVIKLTQDKKMPVEIASALGLQAKQVRNIKDRYDMTVKLTPSDKSEATKLINLKSKGNATPRAIPTIQAVKPSNRIQQSKTISKVTTNDKNRNAIISIRGIKLELDPSLVSRVQIRADKSVVIS